jgi:site-specific recombinase XerC
MTSSTEIIPINIPRSLAELAGNPPAVFLPSAKAAERFFDFFTSHIRNKNTRRAYYNAVCQFSEWCEGRAMCDLALVKPMHVAAYIEGMARAKPTVKQHLAALRMLFDWLVVGHVLDVNPAHAVRGPKYRVKKGKTPLLTRDEARTLLDSIGHRPARSGPDRDHALHLRSRGRRLADERRRLFHARPPRAGAASCEGRHGTRSAMPPQSGNLSR